MFLIILDLLHLNYLVLFFFLVLNNKLYFANSNDELNSFEIYNVNGDFVDDYVTDSEVKSIYAVNDFIFSGFNLYQLARSPNISGFLTLCLT